MIRSEIESMLLRALAENGVPDTTVVIEHPAEETHGDYASNIALVYGKKVGMSPRDFAERLVELLRKQKHEQIEDISVAGPGFINFRLSKDFFIARITDILRLGESFGRNTTLADKKIVVEYTDPNPFKVFHIGHLMTNAIGESLAHIFEFCGGEVKRANYQGDVGLHVAKAIAAKMRHGTIWHTAADIGASYAQGEELFSKEPDYVQEINKKIYEGTDPIINDAYTEGRTISLAAFEEFYKILGTKFDFYFFESDVALLGKTIVEENLHKGVFEKSEGAVIFRGEKYGLHTRVFLTTEGLPPYEAKDLGLAVRKFDTYPYDFSFVITASEQNAYYAVVKEALRAIFPDLAERTTQIGHGMMRVESGKMSSRKGNVVTGESLIHDAIATAEEKMKHTEMDESEKRRVAEQVGIGALKFSILKQAIRSDIVYDPERSFSLEGDSGPYVQYAAVRAQSVLDKASAAGVSPSCENVSGVVMWVERLLSRFPETIERAAREREPHHIALYLLDLAAAFNAFYASEKIIGGGLSAPYRLAVTAATRLVLANGLHMLGISVPAKM